MTLLQMMMTITISDAIRQNDVTTSYPTLLCFILTILIHVYNNFKIASFLLFNLLKIAKVFLRN